MYFFTIFKEECDTPREQLMSFRILKIYIILHIIIH